MLPFLLHFPPFSLFLVLLFIFYFLKSQMTSASNRSKDSICPLHFFSTFLRKNYNTVERFLLLGSKKFQSIPLVCCPLVAEHFLAVKTIGGHSWYNFESGQYNCLTVFLSYIYRVFSVCHEGWGKQGRGGAVAPLIGAGPRGAGSRDCQCPGPRDRGNQV